MFCITDTQQNKNKNMHVLKATNLILILCILIYLLYQKINIHSLTILTIFKELIQTTVVFLFIYQQMH